MKLNFVILTRISAIMAFLLVVIGILLLVVKVKRKEVQNNLYVSYFALSVLIFIFIYVLKETTCEYNKLQLQGNIFNCRLQDLKIQIATIVMVIIIALMQSLSKIVTYIFDYKDKHKI